MGDIFQDLAGPVLGLAGGLIGDVVHGNQQTEQNQQNLANQELFAQNGIQWRVADAVKAGLSPQVAVGATSPSYQPASSGGDDLSEFLSESGQNLGRAAGAGQSQPTQDDILAQKHQQVMDSLDEETARMRLEMMKSDLARSTQQPGIPDAFEKVRMPDGTVIQVPGRDMAVSAFTPYLNQGLGAYGASLGIGNYMQRLDSGWSSQSSQLAGSQPSLYWK